MKVSREVLLNKLETVQPGISPKEIIDQSGCFVFKDGEVMTYNDEVSCRQKVDLKIEGAVTAAPLLAILRKLTEDVVDIQVLKNGCELRIKGKKKQAGIRMEAEIRLEIDVVERPKKWKKLHEDFAEAIHIVGQCVGTDESKPTTTCIHIHPEWVEASDNYQVSQFKMKTGVKTSCLVKQTSLKHIVSLGMTKFSETESWFHFKNPNGLIVSCRRYVEEFGDTAAILAVKGTPTILPKGLAEAVDKAEIFSSETDENQVLIELRPGKLRIRGEGQTGWYSEVKNLKYDGSPMAFRISPELLRELTRQHNKCEISHDRLKVDSGRFIYVTALGRPEADKGDDNE